MRFYDSAYPSQTYIQVKRLLYLQPLQLEFVPARISSLPQRSYVTLPDLKPEIPDQSCACVSVGEQVIFQCSTCTMLRGRTTSIHPNLSLMAKHNRKSNPVNIERLKASTAVNASPRRLGQAAQSQSTTQENPLDQMEMLPPQHDYTSNRFIDRHDPIPVPTIRYPSQESTSWTRNYIDTFPVSSQYCHRLKLEQPNVSLESQESLPDNIQGSTTGNIIQQPRPRIQNINLSSSAPRDWRQDGRTICCHNLLVRDGGGRDG